MQGKSFVRFFTIALVLVVSYIFLLMLPTARIERQATEYAGAKAANIKDQEEKERVFEEAQEYFLDDSIADQRFWYTGNKNYEELKKAQLSLGLDLKGGLSVVLHQTYYLLSALFVHSSAAIFSLIK